MLKPANMSARRLAVLIDCDNARAPAFGRVIEEAGQYGTITVRRGYGDWTTPQMTGWKLECQAYSVQPVQQFRYTTGKNATDSALIIDAMDLLHGGRVNGFCIVSSDSDFTRLAIRIREEGMFVMGVGESHTPQSFVQACVVFVQTDDRVQGSNLGADAQRRQQKSETTRIVEETDIQGEKAIGGSGGCFAYPQWIRVVEEAVGALTKAGAGDSKGWILLTRVGSYIHEKHSDFNTRKYGMKNLSTLVKTRPDLFSTKGGASNIWIRMAVPFSATHPGPAPGKS